MRLMNWLSDLKERTLTRRPARRKNRRGSYALESLETRVVLTATITAPLSTATYNTLTGQAVIVSGSATANSTVTITANETVDNTATAAVTKTVTADASGNYATVLNIATLDPSATTTGNITITADDSPANTTTDATRTVTFNDTTNGLDISGLVGTDGTFDQADLARIIGAPTTTLISGTVQPNGAVTVGLDIDQDGDAEATIQKTADSSGQFSVTGTDLASASGAEDAIDSLARDRDGEVDLIVTSTAGTGATASTITTTEDVTHSGFSRSRSRSRHRGPEGRVITRGDKVIIRGNRAADTLTLTQTSAGLILSGLNGGADINLGTGALKIRGNLRQGDDKLTVINQVSSNAPAHDIRLSGGGGSDTLVKGAVALGGTAEFRSFETQSTLSVS